MARPRWTESSMNLEQDDDEEDEALQEVERAFLFLSHRDIFSGNQDRRQESWLEYLLNRKGRNERAISNNSNEELNSAEPAKCFGDQEANRPLCRFHALGRCKFGEACTFSHQIPTTQEEGNSVGHSVACPFFLKGECRYGDYCRLRHNKADLADEMKKEEGQSSDLICGICYDDIVSTGKRFGLLQCDHCYCLDCLRQWRGSTSMEAEVTRSCPACRLKSDFIVPSRKFCVGKEKIQVINAYKKHLAGTKCKYFDGNDGSCPFGRYCFYAHLNAQGKDVKMEEQPRGFRRKPTCASRFDASSFLDPFIFFLDLNNWDVI